jgi:hypothetical protein
VHQIRAYMARVSGPLPDCIDLHVEAPRVLYRELRDRREGETSERMRPPVGGFRLIGGTGPLWGRQRSRLRTLGRQEGRVRPDTGGRVTGRRGAVYPR